ncbi:MAG: extracellular solute-binding protein [Chloroflexi bacterium]|nr:extracellular solute-binding protein [Chloroflexota bacterium]MCC6896312.1 extracellular solute-binding protein [Anaerolineae bacterium]
MLVALLVASLGGAATASAQGVTELTIWWAQWDPANYLQQIGNDYEAATGIKVNVVQTPWGDFYTRVGTEWAAKGTSYDLIVGDSQWVGQGVTQGHYVDLTEFMTSGGIDKTVTPATLQYYGEYPAGSGKYYAYPTEGDANGWAYRKDLFENPDEMAAFEAKYGYPLAVPETWVQLRDIAEFFTRPDDGLYGVNVYTQKDYDAITMGFENAFFSYGCNWQDDTNNVLGVVNAEPCVQALDLYKELYSFAPPGNTNSFFQEMNDSFTNGQAAMIMNYFAFFPALDSDNNPFRESTGYFVMPKGPDGQQFAALGGQGMSVNAYVDDTRKQAALDFLQWFSQEDTQATWAAYGGYTCNINVLESDTFLNQTPYNAAFAQTMTFVKDFWNIPEFGQLLEPTQRYLHAFIVGGEGTAQEALDGMSEEHDAVLVDAGVIQ